MQYSFSFERRWAAVGPCGIGRSSSRDRNICFLFLKRDVQDPRSGRPPRWIVVRIGRIYINTALILLLNFPLIAWFYSNEPMTFTRAAAAALDFVFITAHGHKRSDYYTQKRPGNRKTLALASIAFAFITRLSCNQVVTVRPVVALVKVRRRRRVWNNLMEMPCQIARSLTTPSFISSAPVSCFTKYTLIRRSITRRQNCSNLII